MEKKWISAVCDTTETTYVFFTTLVRDQEVEGSNPFAPTTFKRSSTKVTACNYAGFAGCVFRVESGQVGQFLVVGLASDIARPAP